MGREIYFMRPTKEGIPADPPYEILMKIHHLLDQAGYELGVQGESSYEYERIRTGIINNGITHYTNTVKIQEAVLPDKTDRDELVDLLRYMVRNIQAGEELVIIDSYIFRPMDAGYIPYLEKLFRTDIAKINSLCIVTRADRHRPTEDAFKLMVQAVNPAIEIQIKFTNDFHDRFWIADKVRGIVVGTSLNGIGRKYAHADYLDADDVKEIYARYLSLA